MWAQRNGEENFASVEESKMFVQDELYYVNFQTRRYMHLSCQLQPPGEFLMVKWKISFVAAGNWT